MIKKKAVTIFRGAVYQGWLMKGTSGLKGDAEENKRDGVRVARWRDRMGEEKGREDKEKGGGGPPY